MNSHDRYRSLDAIRGIAAFGVMLFHYRNHFGAAPFAGVLGPVYLHGTLFVDIFFVMSGYLLATIYAGRRAFGVLVWRRVARLVPLHWAMLAVVTILQHLIVRRHGAAFIYQQNDAYHFLLNLLLLHCSGLSNGFSFDGPAWSISVEWLVNLLLFLLLASGIKRLYLPACALALGALLALWDHSKSLSGIGLYKHWLDVALLRGVLGFFAGVALTELAPLRARQQPETHSRWQRAADQLWDVVLLLGTLAIYAFMASSTLGTRPGVDFAIVLLAIPALIVGAVRGRWAARVLAVAPLQLLGRISYSLYLVHFPMQALFVLLFPPPDHWLNYGRPAVLAGYVAATLVTSYLTWRFLEVPAQALLQSLTIRKPALETSR